MAKSPGTLPPRQSTVGWGGRGPWRNNYERVVQLAEEYVDDMHGLISDNPSPTPPEW